MSARDASFKAWARLHVEGGADPYGTRIRGVRDAKAARKRPWDRISAELADTLEAERLRKRRRG